MAGVAEKLDKLTIGLEEYKEVVLSTLTDQPFDAPRSLEEITQDALSVTVFEVRVILGSKVADKNSPRIRRLSATSR